MVYPVSWTAVCYVTVVTLFIKKVGVVRPNFGGPDPPTPQWLRPWFVVCSASLRMLVYRSNRLWPFTSPAAPPLLPATNTSLCLALLLLVFARTHLLGERIIYENFLLTVCGKKMLLADITGASLHFNALATN